MTHEPVPKPPCAATSSGGMLCEEGPAGRCGSSFKGADAAERPPGVVPPGWGGGRRSPASGSNRVEPLRSSRLPGGTPPGAPSAAHGGFGTGSQATLTQHFTGLKDLGPEGLERILTQALAWKGAFPKHLPDKLLGMVFFNPSLRTRASFEAAMARGGGSAIVLEVGNGVWKLEDRLGAVMDGDRAEHVREAVPVLARYVDALAVRTFATCADDDADHADPVLKAFRELSTVPVISMESAREHPCQGLADLLTVRECFGRTNQVPVTLTWAPHIKPLPKAVPNSFLLTAAAAGCDIRVAHPEGFELHPDIIQEARAFASATGGSVTLTQDQDEALAGSRVVYAKAWGSSTTSALGPGAVTEHPEWMVGPKQMERAAQDAIFLHCLPVRRNVEVADAVLDHPASRVVDQAENRFHVQRALLDWLLNS